MSRDNSTFISMLVCLFLFGFFVLFCFYVVFAVVVVAIFPRSLSFSSPFKGITSVWMEYRILFVCACVCLFTYIFFLRLFLRR